MYYFAYGSNMNWQQMQLRCPSAQFVCVARLPDYRFGITRHSRLRRCGTANVIPARGAEVWGVIYDVSEEDLRALDAFEDGYRRASLSFYPRDNGATPVDALIYLARIEENVPLPNAEYRTLIVEGAKNWNLPHSYICQLEAISTADGR